MEEDKGFFLFKGLKKPLVYKGLKGKYIYYAGGSFVGTLVLAVILSNTLGFFIGIIVALAIGGGLIFNTFRLQKKHGLYVKTKNFDELHVMPNTIKTRKLNEKNRI